MIISDAHQLVIRVSELRLDELEELDALDRVCLVGEHPGDIVFNGRRHCNEKGCLAAGLGLTLRHLDVKGLGDGLPALRLNERVGSRKGALVEKAEDLSLLHH